MINRIKTNYPFKTFKALVPHVIFKAQEDHIPIQIKSLLLSSSIIK